MNKMFHHSDMVEMQNRRRGSDSMGKRLTLAKVFNSSKLTGAEVKPSGVIRGRGGTPRGWHPNEKMWLSLQRTVDKRCQTGEKGLGWHPPGGWHRDTLQEGDTRVKFFKKWQW